MDAGPSTSWRNRHDPQLLPGASVVLPSHNGAARISLPLRSLGRQDLDYALFEVIVVVNGESADTLAAIDKVREEFPNLTIRIQRINVASASLAYSLGTAAARHVYHVYVDDDDWVSTKFLSGMLAHARSDTIVCSPIVDVGPDGEGPLDWDTYVNRSMRPYWGTVTQPDGPAAALSYNAGKMTSTTVARSVSFDRSLRSGMDLDYWSRLAMPHLLDLTVLDPRDGVLYHRAVRPGSISRAMHNRSFASDRVRVITLLGNGTAHDSAIARKLISGQAHLLGEYLEKSPDHRKEVVLQILSTGRSDFPYSRITDVPVRTLAILYAFPPMNDTSALVAARRLWTWGDAFDVICNDLSAIRQTDPGSLRIVQGMQRHRHVVKSPPTFTNWVPIRGFVKEGILKVEAWQAEYGPYERVYSRAQMIASHFLAALVKIRNPDINWVAEFSDPVLRDIEGATKHAKMQPGSVRDEYSAALALKGLPAPEGDNLFQWAEYLAYAFADEILFTNESQMKYMLGYTEDPQLRARASARATVEPHPTLPDEFYRLERPSYDLDAQRTHIGYFGRFYVSRGLTEIVEAIQSLELPVRSRLQLHAFVPNPDELAAEIAEAGLSDVITPNAYVPYLKFLALTTRFDCLLVNDAHTSTTHAINPYLPSKLADYRGSGQPIWALVEPGSPLSKVPVNHQSELGDVTGAAEVFEELVHSKFG